MRDKLSKYEPVVDLTQQGVAYQRAQYASLEDRAVPLLTTGVRVEDRRPPVPEARERPSLLLLASCPECGVPFIFIVTERDTCNVSTVCGRCQGR